ncbi:alpha-amylase family glycosyl hydrolase [Nocardioides sp. S-58]|uniref:Alpha-amylase family glycosyl hydrolase n=1 Tax=Nocardioides renjunii TaxID=3095075 RepID=A0ABU5KFJ5_9ACTN|nr:alpha-amylase family glycosyl hydrolase [Nocardioides sp. S-58]MDZ5663607.1 alpha-amylase family glycosyl hydrolase [Nocardioides sp. S-58]
MTGTADDPGDDLGDDLAARIAPHVGLLYPDGHAEVTRRLVRLADEHAAALRGRTVPSPTHRTSCLITYADGIRRRDEAPLHTLAAFLREQVGEVLSDVHLLPMFPWTSDDGFAVVDHRVVNPSLGSWDDVAELAADRTVMFDFVANHTSSHSSWFLGWLAGDPAYDGFYLEEEPGFDVSRVVRPRTSPLFHPFERPDGSTVRAWTTFGADQVDVDVRHPGTLVELTDVLLGYLGRGASAVRLDAIGFLWKESGTTCLHLPQTHAVIKVWRALVEHVAPGARLLTETNVPHAENISYFGDGHDEAHLVYQFALPPLVLHSFVAQSTARLSEWAGGVGPVSDTATWFNFLASHDGIGMRATEGILDDAERDALVQRTHSHGGRVSWAGRPDGSRAVYELNLSYLDALCTVDEAGDPAVLAAKALAAHSILFAFLGVPAIYYHSLVGSPPDLEGMVTSRINRRINRAVLDADRLAEELRDDPRRRAVFDGMRHLMDVRRRHEAFSPFGTQRVLRLDDRVFVLVRGEGTADELVCVTNVTGEEITLPLSGTDVVTGEHADPLVVGAWGYAWLRPDS